MLTQLAGDYPRVPHRNVRPLALRAWTHLPRFLESPLHGPSVESFDAAAGWLDKHCGPDMPLVIDSGCGTGLSTATLARMHPDAAVLGVDRSAARLAKSHTLPDNALLVRAELATFWRLMLHTEACGGPLSAARVRHHFLLYPNPYPKPSRLNLRWHGHPALPMLLAIGARVEVRSNWRTYLEEFALAAELVAERSSAAGDDHAGHGLRAWAPPAERRVGGRLSAGALHIETLRLESAEHALTPFERKYHEAHQPLYRLELPSS